MTYIILFLQVILYLGNTIFYLVSVIDMDMTIMWVFVFLHLIDLDDLTEEVLNASSVGEDGRYHWYTEE